MVKYHGLGQINFTMKKPLKFNTGEGQDFAATLRGRVESYFKDNNKKKTANALMIFKGAFHLSIWAGSYFLVMFGGFSTAINYLLFAILGVFTALSAVNIGHDAIHGSYSSKRWVNALLSHTFNLNGASAYMWSLMHNSAHHTYTNIDGYDEDVESVPIIRLSPAQELKPIHKYQHLYVLPFYGIATITWVLIKDYVKFFKNEVGNYSGKKHPAKEYFYLFFYKFLYYGLLFVLPFYTIMDATHEWYHIVGGLLLLHWCEGFSLAIIFMLAHVVEKTHFPIPDEAKGGQLEHSWFVHQLYTTANFSSQSWLAAFITGGLNQQVEHHLFPNICSVHYPQLRNIVKGTAEEFGYPYIEEKTFWTALKSHVRFLKAIGSEKDFVPKAF